MRRWLVVALLVLVPTCAWAENLIVQVETVQALPAGYVIGYVATPQKGTFSYAAVVVVPYSSSNQQINSAIADHAKATGIAEFNLVIGGGDTVKVWGGPSN